LRKVVENCQFIQNQALNSDETIGDITNHIERLSGYLDDFCAGKGVKRRRKGNIEYVKNHRDDVERFWAQGYSKIGNNFSSWKKFSEHFRLIPGTLNLVNGIPTHGKTTFVDAMMIESIVDQKWNWAVFSPENKPYYLHIHPLVEKIIGKPFFGDDNITKISSGELDFAIKKLDEHIAFINPDENNRTIQSIKNLTRELFKTRRTDGLIIDPFNKVEVLLKKGENYTNYVKRILLELQYFARDNNICLIVVVHPPKLYKDPKTKEYPVPTLYDIDGSAHWYNGSDNAITVYRNFKKQYVEIHVQKIKFKPHGKLGRCLMRYDYNNGRYNEITKKDIDDPNAYSIPKEEKIKVKQETVNWQDGI
jgi:twinkle protein